MSRPENENPKDRLEKTARELRKHRPRPSEALVTRIERLAERGAARQSHSTRLQLSRRRLVFALAAALAIATVGAIVAGELQQPSKTVASGTTAHTPGSIGAPKIARKKLAPFSESSDQTGGGTSVYQYAEKVPTSSAGAKSSALSLGGTPTSAKQFDKAQLASITSGNRLAELHAILMLKVENRDQLSQRTAQAMKIARSLSGYVVSTQVNAPSRGVATSYLVLKVPAKRSQEALIRISELGKILSQQVSLVDVKGTVTAEGKSIQALKREIASLEQTLRGQTLTAQARSQLQIQLARDRARLSSLRTQRTKDILRGRLATITLTLTTGDLPKLAARPSRIHKAIDRAWDGLSSEISWAAMAIIVSSPFLLLAAVLAVLVRVRKRREERRLLEK